MQKVDPIEESKRRLLKEFINELWNSIVTRVGENILGAFTVEKKLYYDRTDLESKLRKYFPIKLTQFEVIFTGNTIILSFVYELPFKITEETIEKLSKRYFYFKSLNFGHKSITYDFFYKSRLEVIFNVETNKFYIYTELSMDKSLKNLYLSLRKCIYFVLRAILSSYYSQ